MSDVAIKLAKSAVSETLLLLQWYLSVHVSICISKLRNQSAFVIQEIFAYLGLIDANEKTR